MDEPDAHAPDSMVADAGTEAGPLDGGNAADASADDPPVVAFGAWPGFPDKGELFETAPIARFRNSLRSNLEGPYLLTRALIAEMRAAQWGRVVFVSTGLVKDGFPGSAAYLSAKAGLHGLTRTMARELAPAGILTNLVMPGFTLTEGRTVPAPILNKVQAATSTGRATSPEDVARVVVFLGSAANSHMNGEEIRVDGHFFAPTP